MSFRAGGRLSERDVHSRPDPRPDPPARPRAVGRRARLPRAGRAAPARARGPRLPDARLVPRRRGRRPGDADARVATLDRFERRSSISTWLYRIATNACLDELERRPRRPEPVVRPISRLAAGRRGGSPVVDPAARYAMAEGVELAFLTAIQRLPGRQRAILDPARRSRLDGRRGRRAAGDHGGRRQLSASSERAATIDDDAAGRARATAAAPSQTRTARLLRRRLGRAPTWTRSSRCCARTPSCGCRRSASIVGDRAIGRVLRERPVRRQLAGDSRRATGPTAARRS